MTKNHRQAILKENLLNGMAREQFSSVLILIVQMRTKLFNTDDRHCYSQNGLTPQVFSFREKDTVTYFTNSNVFGDVLSYS